MKERRVDGVASFLLAFFWEFFVFLYPSQTGTFSTWLTKISLISWTWGFADVRAATVMLSFSLLDLSQLCLLLIGKSLRNDGESITGNYNIGVAATLDAGCCGKLWSWSCWWCDAAFVWDTDDLTKANAVWVCDRRINIDDLGDSDIVVNRDITKRISWYNSVCWGDVAVGTDLSSSLNRKHSECGNNGAREIHFSLLARERKNICEGEY